MSSLRTARPASKEESAPEKADVRIPIEELSRQTGVTVRNLRELQTRGLLEPPELLGRKGLYTQRHLARVSLVRTLQDRGYSLASIGDLLKRWQGALGPLGVMGIEDGLSTPGAPADRQLGEKELFAVLPELKGNARLLASAVSTELVVKNASGGYHAPVAEYIETARVLTDFGIPLDVQFEDFRTLRAELEVMATRFRSRFQEHVIAPLQSKEMPASAVEELADRVAKLRPAVVHGVALALSAIINRGGPLTSAREEPPRAKKPGVPAAAPKRRPGPRAGATKKAR